MAGSHSVLIIFRTVGSFVATSTVMFGLDKRWFSSLSASVKLLRMLFALVTESLIVNLSLPQRIWHLIEFWMFVVFCFIPHLLHFRKVAAVLNDPMLLWHAIHTWVMAQITESMISCFWFLHTSSVGV